MRKKIMIDTERKRE